MSVRLQITHVEKIGTTNVTYRADISDADFSGTATEKVVSENFFDWEYDKINERDPFENPVQKSSFECDLLIQQGADLTILNDILDADEDRFTIEFYIDGDHKWSGKVLNDLLEYSEGPFPFTAKIKAKDVSNLDGVDYDLVTNATLTRISEIIAECLKKTGLTLPLRSYTNLTNSEIVDQSQDFLFALYHQKFALRDKDSAISCADVLGHICRVYNLIIRQSDARWIIEQLPAVAKGDDVQFDYDANGLNPVSSTPSRTITIDRVDSFLLPSSVNKVTGALKSITSRYKHRVLIFNIETEDVHHISPSNQTEFNLDFENEGGFLFAISVDAEAVTSTGFGTQGTAYFEVEGVIPGEISVYLDQATGAWSTGSKQVGIDLSGDAGTVSGSLTIEDTDAIPSDVATIRVRFLWADVEDSGGTQETSEVSFTNINALIYNQTLRDWNATLRYKYTRTGNYSVTEEIEETLLGDGPTSGDNFASKGRPAIDDFIGDQVSPGSFKIRGVSESLTLEEIRLRERVNMRRSALRNIRARLWMKFSPESLISYDGQTWFFLGGYFKANRSTWDANILLLDYDGTTTGDVFQTIVEEGGDPAGASEGSTPSSGTGLSLEQADTRYLQQANNLDDLDDPETAQANMGLHDQTADLDLSSISVEGVNLFPSLDAQALGISDAPSFAGLTSTGDISVTNTINIDAPAGSRPQLFFQKIGTSKWHVEYDDISGDSLRWVESGVAVRHHFHAGGNVQLGGALMVNASSLVGTETLRVAGAALIEGAATVQGGLFASEFVTEQTRVMFDFRMAPGGGKIESVTGTAGSETITLSSEGGATNPLSVGAIILIQERTGESSGTIIKQIYRKVDSITGMDATLSDSGITWTAGTDDTGAIEAGDNVTYEGHTSDGTLDHFIHYDIAGIDIPAIRFWDGVSDVGGGTEVMRVGGLGTDFGVAIGSQTFAETGIQMQYNSGTPRAFIGSGEDNQFSLSFDGVDDYVEANQTFDGVGDFTWEIDFKTEMTDFGYIMQEASGTVDGSTTAPYLTMKIRDTGTITLETSDGTTASPFSTTGTYNDGTWYHAAIRRTGDTFSILVLDMQGNVLEEVSSVIGTYDTVATGNKFFIGRLRDQAFEGNLDNPRVWNTYRTNAEIIADYRTELAGTESGLLWYSEFDTGSGSTATDKVGTNDGAINGAAWSKSVPFGHYLKFDSEVDIRGHITAITGSLVDLTVDGILEVTGGDVKIGKDVYNSATLGPRDGFLLGADTMLISDQGIDIDARQSPENRIEWHDTDASDDLNSNSNLVGWIAGSVNVVDDLNTISIRAQSSLRDSEVVLTATSVEVNAKLRGSSVSIADDSSTTLRTGVDGGFIFVNFESGFDGTIYTCLASIDLTGNILAQNFAQFEIFTGSPDLSTTDGKVGIYISSNGTVSLENRDGQTNTFSYLILE